MTVNAFMMMSLFFNSTAASALTVRDKPNKHCLTKILTVCKIFTAQIEPIPYNYVPSNVVVLHFILACGHAKGRRCPAD
jgi:hypothetical protein